MNLPETRLRSWQPRRPSNGLKRRIFAAPRRPYQVVMWSLRRLSPAAACLLVALAALKQGISFSSAGPRPEFIAATTGSNLIAFLPGNYQQEQNCCSPVTFEWTNRSGSTSSISSFPRGKVN